MQNFAGNANKNKQLMYYEKIGKDEWIPKPEVTLNYIATISICLTIYGKENIMIKNNELSTRFCNYYYL